MEKRKSNRKIQYLIASCVSVGSMAMGCSSSWPAPVMPKFHDNETGFDISQDEMSWMVSMSSPGFVAGSLVSRYVSDRLGRRMCMLGSAIPVTIGSIIVLCASQAWLLYIVRFLWGCGNGMITTVASMYLAEIADKEIRGSLSLMTRFMFNFGNLLMMTVGPFVSYQALNYLMMIPMVYLVGCWWIPESPYFYLKEGKVDAARNVLLKLRTCKEEKVIEDELLQMQADVRNEMRRSSTAKELFTGKQYRTAIIIAVGLKFTQLMTGLLLIQQYLGLIMKESKTSMSLATVFIIFGGVRFIVGVMSSVLADRVGRRPLLIYSYIGTGLSLAVVGLYFFLLEVIHIDHEVLSPYGFITFTGINLANIISTLGYNSIIVVIPAEIFPLNIKAIAMTSLSIFGGGLNFFVSRGYQMIKDWTGLCGIFWIYGGMSFIGAIFSYIVVPETKGKSLRDIQILLQGDMYVFDEAYDKLNVIVDDNVILPESKELKELNRENGKLL